MKIVLDHTWEYVGGSKATIPDVKDAAYDSWVIEDRNAHRRIWLALSDHVQDSIILHTNSHAAELFLALKGTYEFSGASAEYYAQQDYDNPKISDYDSLGEFITALMNLAHLVNKEIKGSDRHVQEHHIAMRVIHSLPPLMQTLQTILLKNAPSSIDAKWDLPSLKLQVVSDKQQAHAAGENLGTKLDVSHELNALAVKSGTKRPRRRDVNDPSWLSQQSCWWCGKMGHIHQKCTASQAEKDAYCAMKGNMNVNINAASVESDTYTEALIVEEVTPDNVTLVASNSIPKPWVIDLGCTSHFTPNQSDFVSYMPYTEPQVVCMGDAHGIPSLGEGTIQLTCIVNKKHVTCFVHDIQYIPGVRARPGAEPGESRIGVDPRDRAPFVGLDLCISKIGRASCRERVSPYV